MKTESLRKACELEKKENERMRTLVREVGGRGPLGEIEREEYRKLMKDMNDIIASAKSKGLLDDNASVGMNDGKDAPSPKSSALAKQAYRSLLASSTLFKAIFK